MPAYKNYSFDVRGSSATNVERFLTPMTLHRNYDYKIMLLIENIQLQIPSVEALVHLVHLNNLPSALPLLLPACLALNLTLLARPPNPLDQDLVRLRPRVDYSAVAVGSGNLSSLLRLVCSELLLPRPQGVDYLEEEAEEGLAPQQLQLSDLLPEEDYSVNPNQLHRHLLSINRQHQLWEPVEDYLVNQRQLQIRLVSLLHLLEEYSVNQLNLHLQLEVSLSVSWRFDLLRPPSTIVYVRFASHF